MFSKIHILYIHTHTHTHTHTQGFSTMLGEALRENTEKEQMEILGNIN